MKYLYIILALLMCYFTAVQFNDPDALLWIILYGSSVILLFMAAFNRFPLIPLILVSVAYLVGIVILFPGVIEWINKEHGENLMQKMSDGKMYIEETRECLGLIIALIFILIPLSVAIKNRRQNIG
jgi:hypothetical protein